MSLSREKINHLSQISTKGLAELPGGTLHAPENTIRLEIVRAMQDALKLEEKLRRPCGAPYIPIRVRSSKGVVSGT